MKNARSVKVLAVVCQMSLGGLQSRLLDIIREINYDRVCIDVYTYRQERGILDDVIVDCGGTVYYNPPLTPKNMIWYVQYFKEFLIKHPEYKIVHAHQDAWCAAFCKGAYLAGVPVRIAHSRTAISTVTLSNIVKNIIKLPVNRYATHYWAVSEVAGIWLFGKKRMKSGEIKIWKNAIDCQKYRFNKTIRDKVRKQMMIEDKIVLMHVGNFTPPKNQIFLLDVLEKILEKENGYVLFFVGEETELGLQKKVKKKAMDMGLLNNIQFLGSRNDIDYLLQAADVFCFPSLYEGLPGAVLEAQAAGLPSVISSTITQEVKVLSSTKMLPVDGQTVEWIKEILNSSKVERRDTYDEMVFAGFDIKFLTKELTEFYENVWEEKNAL